MSDKKKIKDTKLGAWLSEKAPSILGVVGDLLPDSGALGVVKNLIDKDDSVDSEEAQRMIDAEVRFQENVTERWKADMGSDVKLAKLIRPLTLRNTTPYGIRYYLFAIHPVKECVKLLLD